MKKIVILSLLLGIVLGYVFLFNLQASSMIETDVRSFEKTGFIDAETLTNSDRFVTQNENFELYLDETTSYFRILDKRTGIIWRSNPIEKDPWETTPGKTITVTAVEKQKSTLEITYFDKAGASTTINNYKLAISHPASVLNDAGARTFDIKYLPNGFQVLYRIEDLEIDYLFFPKYLPKDVMETLEDRSILESIAYKGFNEETNLYEITAYESMSRLVKNRLYEIFYEKLGYTRERAIEENALYGYFEFYEKVSFEVAVEVLLTEEGMKTTILRDSIVEPDNVKIANIILYPLFGTAVSEINDVESEGYIVLPDGNGAIIDFNNGKSYQNPYRKHLYGQDLSLLPFKMEEEQQKINIPLYGMIKEEGGYAAIITEGDAMANIHADVSGRIDSYNKVFTSFDMRETERVMLGSGFNQYGVNLWTKKIVDTDFSVEYHFLHGEENSYVGVANAYRSHLIEQGLSDKDQTDETILNLSFIGAYDKKEFILGVPYYTTRSMTTFKQAESIVSEMMNRNLTSISVNYLGLMNGGLSSDIHTKADIERILGGKRGYDHLEDQFDQWGIPLYANIDLSTASDYHKLFDRFRYTASRIDGSLSLAFTYHYPSRLPYSETQYQHSADDYVINPLYYQAIYDRFTKNYDGNYLSMGYLGSVLSGHYTKKDVIYKQDALRIQQEVLSKINETIMLENPLGFAIPYADVITDLPTEATLYSIIDDQIPLLQLVLSGLIDYSTQSINVNNTRSVEYNFLKVLETGSNLKYTLSYDDSRELLSTEYNYYMSTEYTNWIDLIEEQVNTMDMLGIHEGYLINHERIRFNVYRVTYSHGLSLLINYNLNPVTIGTITMDALDYVVVGG